VWFRQKRQAYNKGMSIGSGGAVGAALSHGVGADDKMAAIALGGIMGTTWAGIWESYDIKIWCLNQGQPEPPRVWYAMMRKEPWPPKPKVESPPPPINTGCDNKLKKCESDNEQLEAMLKDSVKEKDWALNIPVCPFSVEYPLGKWQLCIEQQRQIPQIAKWLAEKWGEAKKRKMQWVFIGNADQRGPQPIQKDQLNPFLGQWRGRWTAALVAEELIKKFGFTKDQVKEIAWAGSGKDFPVVPDAKAEAQYKENRHAYLVLVAPGVQGYNTQGVVK